LTSTSSPASLAPPLHLYFNFPSTFT
jgi:hypothetical protein